MSDGKLSDYDAYIVAVAANKDQSRREQAERMTIGERLLAGPDLFDMGVSMMRAGIRLQHPEATETAVEQMIVERLRLARRFER